MSARFSSSPALHLTIGSSRFRSALLAGVLILSMASAGFAWVRGHHLIAFVLLFYASLLHLSARKDPVGGTALRLDERGWQLQQGVGWRLITMQRQCAATPWLVCLCYRELYPVRGAGASRWLWLFADAVQPDELRRLRAQFTLARNSSST